MSLHYLVKLEMLVGHVVLLLSEKKNSFKLQKFSHLNCGPQIRQI